jgi:cyanophycinase
MTSEESAIGGGAIALVGSGEYTAAMNEADSALLTTIGGASAARVALLPTASGQEPGSPARWNAMGVAHFTALGVRDVRPIALLDRTSAAGAAQLAQLQDANFFYFSGGDPNYLIETLRGTPAWECISAAYARGAVLAGCSAGAMALGGYTLSLRAARSTGRFQPEPALGIVPRVVVFPHFDRTGGFFGPGWLDQALGALPAGLMALGIDEDTALLRLGGASEPRWRVFGRQTVSLFAAGARRALLHAGDEVTLDEWPPA